MNDALTSHGDFLDHSPNDVDAASLHSSVFDEEFEEEESSTPAAEEDSYNDFHRLDDSDIETDSPPRQMQRALHSQEPLCEDDAGLLPPHGRHDGNNKHQVLSSDNQPLLSQVPTHRVTSAPVLPPPPVGPSKAKSIFDTRRVFVGRLVKGVAIDVLQKHFSAFGKLERILLPEDAITGRSKGYAFITFVDKASVTKVLQSPQIIAGTEVDCKPALMKDSTTRDKSMQPIGTLFKTNKIFIGGLPPSVTASVMRSYFAQYGVLTSCKVIMDKVTGQSKGYGFCEYTEPACVDRVMKHYDIHVLNGKWVQVKRAMPAALREAYTEQLAARTAPSETSVELFNGDSLLGPGDMYRNGFRPPENVSVPPPRSGADIRQVVEDRVRGCSSAVSEEEGQLADNIRRPLPLAMNRPLPANGGGLKAIRSVAAAALRKRHWSESRAPPTFLRHIDTSDHSMDVMRDRSTLLRLSPAVLNRLHIANRANKGRLYHRYQARS